MTVELAASPPSTGRKLTSLLMGRPANSLRSTSRARRAAPKTDLVLCEHLSSASLAMRFAKSLSAQLVYISQNDETEVRKHIAQKATGLRRLLRILDSFSTARTERRLLRKSVLVTGITLSDCSSIARRSVTPPIWLPPVGASDLEVISAAASSLSRPYSERMRAIAVFGSSTWEVKQAAYLELLKTLTAALERDSGCEVHLLGNHPDSFLAQVKRLFPSVIVVGFIEDPRRQLGQYRWGAVHEPDGGGFQMRVLDYVVAGTPFFATSAGTRGLRESKFARISSSTETMPLVLSQYLDDEPAWHESALMRGDLLPSAVDLQLADESVIAAFRNLTRSERVA